MTFPISQRGKEYLETARTLLRAAQTMTDQAIASQLKALADDYERRAEKASHVDAAKALARSAANLAGHPRALPLIRESTITKFCAMHWLVRASDSAFPTKIEFFWKRLLACDAR